MKLGSRWFDWSVCASSTNDALWSGLRGGRSVRCIKSLEPFLTVLWFSELISYWRCFRTAVYLFALGRSFYEVSWLDMVYILLMSGSELFAVSDQNESHLNIFIISINP